MTDITSETTRPDFELVAQAARLVAPVASAPARSRRVFPPPPPPPIQAATMPLPASEPSRSPPASDLAALLAWEEAAEQLEPDWATPVPDDEVIEHTAPLAAVIASEPETKAVQLPLLAIDAGARNEMVKASDAGTSGAGTSDALSMVEANLIGGTPSESSKADAAEEAGTTSEESAKVEGESELEALARSVTKSSPESRTLPAEPPGRAVLSPPFGSRALVPPPPPPLAASRAPVTPVPGPFTPLAAPATPLPTLPPLSSPVSRPLPPLAALPSSRPPPPPPSRVPPPSRTKSMPLPDVPLTSAARSQMPTLPRMADLMPAPVLPAPSLLDIRNSPVARRFYAQLGVAAVFGALLATISFALIPRQTTSVTVAASQPATPAADTATAASKTPAPAAATAQDETEPEPAKPDTTVDQPVAEVSVDDLARELAPAAKPSLKSSSAGALAAAAPAAKLASVAPPAAKEPPPASAANAEAAAPSTKGTLHINATPPANIAVNGRPLGMTPKIVRVAPGTHRVALIGPGGRRSQTVNVAPGRTATVSVKF